jgi:hypothetical protein
MTPSNIQDGNEWVANNANDTFTYRYVFRVGDGKVWWHYYYSKLRCSTIAAFDAWITRRGAHKTNQRA